jgi:hydrogenase/urease accessory protein HupE
MRNLARIIFAAAGALAPFSAFAHQGPHRDEALWSLLHAATNADHLSALGVAALVSACIAALLAMRPGSPRSGAR